MTKPLILVTLAKMAKTNCHTSIEKRYSAFDCKYVNWSLPVSNLWPSSLWTWVHVRPEAISGTKLWEQVFVLWQVTVSIGLEVRVYAYTGRQSMAKKYDKTRTPVGKVFLSIFSWYSTIKPNAYELRLVCFSATCVWFHSTRSCLNICTAYTAAGALIPNSFPADIRFRWKLRQAFKIGRRLLIKALDAVRVHYTLWLRLTFCCHC